MRVGWSGTSPRRSKPLRVVNEPTGIAKIVSVLRARDVGRVVLEAIGRAFSHLAGEPTIDRDDVDAFQRTFENRFEL